MQRTDGDRQRRQHLADVSSGRPLRLLPWTTDDGKPCMLSTSDPDSFLSRLADDFEVAQLAAGAHVLTEARKVLDDPMSPHAEIRYAGIRLADCLVDVLRVAESRGMRLPVSDSEEDESDAQSPAEATPRVAPSCGRDE